jgi:hypothetical protein
LEIQDKLLHRWQDCFLGMEGRFPTQTPIWSINVGDGRGGYDFAALFQELDRHGQASEELDRWYSQGRAPLDVGHPGAAGRCSRPWSTSGGGVRGISQQHAQAAAIG